MLACNRFVSIVSRSETYAAIRRNVGVAMQPR